MNCHIPVNVNGNALQFKFLLGDEIMRSMSFVEFFEIYKKSIQKIDDEMRLNNAYLFSYKHFVAYFNSLNVIDEQAFFIGANFTYGWMPTILKHKINNKTDPMSYLQNTIGLLNDAKNGRQLVKADFEYIKPVINNSIVGTSKLLHFINPSLYPIWDSKICSFFTGKKTPSYANNVDRYLAYKCICEKLEQDVGIEDIHEAINELLGVLGPVSRMRAIEMVFFNAHRK